MKENITSSAAKIIIEALESSPTINEFRENLYSRIPGPDGSINTAILVIGSAITETFAAYLLNQSVEEPPQTVQ